MVAGRFSRVGDNDNNDDNGVDDNDDNDEVGGDGSDGGGLEVRVSKPKPVGSFPSMLPSSDSSMVSSPSS